MSKWFIRETDFSTIDFYFGMIWNIFIPLCREIIRVNAESCFFRDLELLSFIS